MLYVTTRNDKDVLTAHRAFYDSISGDGGLYVPFRPLRFSREEMDALLSGSFSQCTAEILNRLSGSKLSAWDVEFATGRKSVRLKNLGHRMILGETWHNPQWDFAYTVRKLTDLLLQESGGSVGDWVAIAARTAVLFGIFSQLRSAEVELPVDISVVSGDFSGVMSVWYARQWGLPVGNIICCCNENNAIWDLFSNGQMRTDTVSIPTSLPEGDVTIPRHLERLIYAVGGTRETERYLERCRQGRAYSLEEGKLNVLRQGVYISVVSSRRTLQTIQGVYSTHGYVLSPYGALAYAGAVDYRAYKAATRNCLVLSERSPACDSEITAKALGISQDELKKVL